MIRRTLGFTAILTLILFFLTGYYSCIKDKCSGIVCQNGGICVDGACACIDGYEGTNCGSKWHSKFSGKWTATDKYNADTGTRIYPIEIAGTSPDSFRVYGLSGRANVLCTKAANRKFTILPDQKTDTLLTVKSGNGTLNDDGSVTGVYSFLQRTLINDTTAKDTIITSKFTWTR